MAGVDKAAWMKTKSEKMDDNRYMVSSSGACGVYSRMGALGGNKRKMHSGCRLWTGAGSAVWAAVVKR